MAFLESVIQQAGVEHGQAYYSAVAVWSPTQSERGISSQASSLTPSIVKRHRNGFPSEFKSTAAPLGFYLLEGDGVH